MLNIWLQNIWTFLKKTFMPFAWQLHVVCVCACVCQRQCFPWMGFGCSNQTKRQQMIYHTITGSYQITGRHQCSQNLPCQCIISLYDGRAGDKLSMEHVNICALSTHSVIYKPVTWGSLYYWTNLFMQTEYNVDYLRWMIPQLEYLLMAVYCFITGNIGCVTVLFTTDMTEMFYIKEMYLSVFQGCPGDTVLVRYSLVHLRVRKHGGRDRQWDLQMAI